MDFSVPGFEFVRMVKADPICEVWEGRQRSPARTVAIRVFAHPLLVRPDCRPFLLDEIRRASVLNHPSLPVVYDVGQLPDERIYSIGEWTEGEHLLDRLSRMPGPIEKALFQYASDVARALQFAWDQCGMAHGHLQPDDIVFGQHGYPQILNFGQTGIGAIRKAMPGSREYVNLLADIPFYTSPEMARAQTVVDFRTDIYSLGAILYHALTGRAPFRESARLEVLDKHLFGQLEDPIDINPKVSANAAWLVEKMMVKDPRSRPASWTEVISDLEAVRDRRPPSKPWPEAGRSTVSRGAARQSGGAGGKRPRTLTTAPAAPAAKPTVLSAAEAAEVRTLAEETRRKSNGPAMAVPIAIVLSALLVFGAYRLYQRGFFKAEPPTFDPIEDAIRHGQIGGGEEEPVPVTPTRRPSPVTRPPSVKPSVVKPPPVIVEPEKPAIQPAPSTEPLPVPAPVVVNPPSDEPKAQPEDPDFLKGAQLFNSAVAVYERWKSNQSDMEGLRKIETLAKQATQAFESFQKRNPDEAARAKGPLDQCYKMERMAREHMLANGGLHSRTPIPKAPIVLPAPASSVDSVRPRVPPPPVTPPSAGTGVTTPAAPAVAAEGDLKLAAAWNRPYASPLEKLSARDLQDLLNPRGQPNVDTRPQAISVALGVSYLATAAEAAKTLGGVAGDAVAVPSPSFPTGSFQVRPVKGDFGGYPLARLVCDLNDRVAAIQLVDDRPQPKTSLPAPFFTEQWVSHDLVMSRMRSTRTQLIAHRTQAVADGVTIESELAEPQADGSLKSLARYTLHLPKPMVELILARTRAGGL